MNGRFFFLLMVTALWATGLSSCITHTGQHFMHLGREGQCMLLHMREGDSLAFYQVEGKIYAKGTLTTYHEYNPGWCNSIDRAATDYKRTTDGAPRQTVYKELVPVRERIPDVARSLRAESVHYREYLRVADSHHLTELPAGAKPYSTRMTFAQPLPHRVSDNEVFRQAIITQECSANLHALYAYPLAAVCYVGIDAPVILVQGAAAIVALPFISCYDRIARYYHSAQEREGKEINE